MTKKPDPPPELRQVQELHINPFNGAVMALASDGSLWIRDGHHGSSKKPWTQLPDLPPITNKVEESEDDITSIV